MTEIVDKALSSDSKQFVRYRIVVDSNQVLVLTTHGYNMNGRSLFVVCNKGKENVNILVLQAFRRDHIASTIYSISSLRQLQ